MQRDSVSAPTIERSDAQATVGSSPPKVAHWALDFGVRPVTALCGKSINPPLGVIADEKTYQVCAVCQDLYEGARA